MKKKKTLPYLTEFYLPLYPILPQLILPFLLFPYPKLSYLTVS